MPYITQAQIEAKIPASKLNDALDDDQDGAADNGLLDQILADASAEVDGFLQGRYAVPFPVPYPAVVVAAALYFALENIYGRRETPEERNPWSAKARIYRGTNATPGVLTKIANRELPLDAAETEAIEPGAVIREENPFNASLR